MTFTCKRCGKCCGFVPFTKPEYKRVKPTADKLGISFTKTTMLDKTVYVAKDLLKQVGRITDDFMSGKEITFKDLVCPFLGFDASGKSFCRIYDLRPEVCRLFGDHPEHPHLRCPNNYYLRSNKNAG